MATAPGSNGAKPPTALLKKAEKHARAGDIAEAARFFIAAGNAYLNDFVDPERARDAFGRAAAIDPSNLDAIFQMGHTYVVEGKLREALPKFVHVIQQSNQTHVPALFEIGCIYQQLGKYDQSILAFRKVLDRDRTNIQAIVNLARRLEAMGMRPEALGHFFKAAETAFEAKHFGTCRQLLNIILSMDPLNAKVRSLLADLNELVDEPAPVNVRVETPPVHDKQTKTIAAVLEKKRSAVEDEKAMIAALREERDRLKDEINGLCMAKAAEQIELASMRARHGGAVAELTGLFKKVEALKSKSKRAARSKTSKTRSGRTRG
jgi:tetratricopeptide (TPR) repeat protein